MQDGAVIVEAVLRARALVAQLMRRECRVSSKSWNGQRVQDTTGKSPICQRQKVAVIEKFFGTKGIIVEMTKQELMSGHRTFVLRIVARKVPLLKLRLDNLIGVLR